MRGSAAFRTGVAPGGALAPGWVKNELWRKARTVPSLDLRFADNKSLVDATTGASLVTFTRASSGTFVGSDGLLKTAVTNLLLRSEEFDNASWGKSAASITANNAIAPNGASTADALIPNTTTTFHFCSQGFTLVNGTTYTFSIYLKAAGYNFVVLNTPLGSASGNAGPIINLSNGTQAGFFTFDYPTLIQSVGNGWYRVSYQYTSSGTFGVIDINTLPTSSISAYAGDGTSGIYAWGAQLEQASTVGEYIPTTSTINSAPRFDHNPTTGESLGLLVEEARTNLLLRSEEFGTWWTPIRASVSSNTITAPNGAATADTLIEDTTASNNHQLYSGATQGAGTYTVSIYAKAAGRSVFQIQQESGGNSRFTLTGDGTALALGVNTVSISSVGNGWYRCTSTYVATGAHFIYIALSDGTSTTYTGDGTSGIYIWGAQLEAGAFATSYIPTTTAAATRSEDVASITGTAFSSWYNQTEGTVFVNGVIPFVGSANFPAFASVDDGNINDAIEFAMWDAASDVVKSVIYDNGTAQASLGGETYTAGSVYSLAGAFALNNFAASYRGGSPSTDSAGTLPTVDRLRIGQNRGGGNNLNGTIRRICFWPTRLPDNTLQSITL